MTHGGEVVLVVDGFAVRVVGRAPHNFGALVLAAMARRLVSVFWRTQSLLGRIRSMVCHLRPHATLVLLRSKYVV